nr:MAG TPA: hypothetical protein [Caudoviricetes sp.]
MPATLLMMFTNSCVVRFCSDFIAFMPFYDYFCYVIIVASHPPTVNSFL